MTTSPGPSAASPPAGAGRVALAGAALAATSGLVAAYASVPAEIARALLPGRMLVLAAVVALLGAAFQRAFAAACGCVAALAARGGLAGRFLPAAVVVAVGWCVTGALTHAPQLPVGRQMAAEIALAPACLALLAAAAWAGSAASGASRPASVRLAFDVAPAFVVLSIALRGDLSRFALLSQPVRVYLAALVVGAAGLAASSAAIEGRRTAIRLTAALGLAGAAAGLLWFDATLLRRLYPEMHLAAWTGAVLCSARLAAAFVRDRRGPVTAWIVPLALVAAAAASADAALRAELFRRVGPLGRVARTAGVWLGPWTIGDPAPRIEPLPGAPARDVGDRPCVLLISVDALRADRLAPGTMPNVVAWAGGGTWFTAARTVYPGTHQTFGSVLCGRLTLGESPGDTAIVDAFRAAGWRTISVGDLAEQHYVRGRFDVVESPPARDDAWSAGRFREHLRAAAAGGPPVFAWLHVDRPHAPYLPSVRPPGARTVDLYDACVRDTDLLLRDVLADVDALAAARPTVVALFADHGEEFGEHGGEYHLSSVYDVQIRVPLVLHGAGVPAGSRSDAVSLVDLGPTALDAAGLAVPAGLHGRSLLPLVRGGSLPARPVLAALADSDTGRLAWMTAIVDPWKLVADPVSGTLELFRLDEDPHERVNRIHEASSAPPELFRALSLDPPR